MLESTKSFLKNNKENIQYGASFLADIGNSIIDYNVLKTENSFNEIQASQIELQALQQVNQMREQFNNQIGNYQYNTAMRGLKYGGDGLEKSAKNFGEDMSTINTNAKFKANALRTQTRISNKYANASLISGVGGAFGSLSSSLNESNSIKGK